MSSQNSFAIKTFWSLTTWRIVRGGEMRKLIIVGTILAIALIAGTAFAIGEIGDQPCVNCPTSTSESEQIQTEESSELSFGASVAIVMLLGVAAATLVAGARTATRRG